VLDHFVKTFDTSTPILEFPVNRNMRGFYVSVVLAAPASTSRSTPTWSSSQARLPHGLCLRDL